MIPNPHVPGVLDAPITATESGANKYCQWLSLLNTTLPNSPSLYVNSTRDITQSLVLVLTIHRSVIQRNAKMCNRISVMVARWAHNPKVATSSPARYQFSYCGSRFFTSSHRVVQGEQGILIYQLLCLCYRGRIQTPTSSL